MPEIYPFLVCFGILFFLLPIIICIVLAARLSGLRQRVEQMEIRLADMAREFLRQAHPTAPGRAAPPRVEYLETPPAYPPAAPVHPAAAPIPPAPPRPAQPAPPAPRAPVSVPTSVMPPTSPALAHASSPAAPLTGSVPVSPPAAIPSAAPTPAAPARTPTTPFVPLPRLHVEPQASKVSPPRSLESYLIPGFIVIGSIILALAAIFLVKIGIDKKVFGPLQRDWASVIGAFILVALGQWWRKRLGFWSQGLIGAGLVAFFAAVFAATTLHHFLTPLQGFIILGLATAGAVAMSLQNWSAGTDAGNRGGVLIAALGLIGGFLTPILVNSGRDDVPGLFGYLMLLHVGLITVTRFRGWSVLAGASTVLSSLWLIFWVVFKWNPAATPDDGVFLGLFMLASVATLVLATATQPDKWNSAKSGFAAHVLTWIAVALGILSACLLLGKSHFDNLQWAFFALLAAGSFIIARLRPMYEGMASLASIVVLAMLAAWGATVPLTGIEVSSALRAEHLRFQNWLLGFGIASFLAAYICQWKSTAPFRWALLAALSTIAYVLTAYTLLPVAPRPDAWAFLPLAAAAILAACMVPILLRRRTFATAETTLTLYAQAVLALLLMAPPMALHGGTLTAAWAAIIPLTALAIWRLKLPGLLVGLLVATGVLAVRALFIETVFNAGGPGCSLIWNPVVWAYGSALIALALASWFLEQCGDLPDRFRTAIPGPQATAALLQVCSAICALLLFTLEVRWAFHNGRLDEPSAFLMERSTFAVGTLLLAAALAWIGGQLQRVVLVRCGQVAAILGILYAVGGLVILTNPLWWLTPGHPDDVGPTPILNGLLYAYGAPAAVCGLLAWILRRTDPDHSKVAQVTGAAGIILLFALVSLQVRQGFAGGQLVIAEHRPPLSFLEFSTYSTVWLTLGAALLAIGKRWSFDLLRRAGILVCSLALGYAILVVGLFQNPLFQPIRVGDGFLFNHLLFAYGLPIVLAGLAAWIIHPAAENFFGPWTEDSERAFANGWKLGWVLRTAMMILLFILVSTEVRQAFQGACLNRPHCAFMERATYPLAWFAGAGVLLALGYRFQSRAARRGGLAFAAIALGFALLICTLAMNPLFTRDHVGAAPIFNGLLYAYGIPAALSALLAWFFWKHAARLGGTQTEQVLAWFLAIGSLLFVFALVTLEIQHAFRGDRLFFGPSPPGTPSGEIAAYSIAWALLGIIYLIAGILRQSLLLRAASLAMMLLTIPKIFLFDIAATQDFQRVLSFAGVGVCLLALAFVYQRFVFRKSQPAPTDPAP
jgi:uncharacterized membrane protein